MDRLELDPFMIDLLLAALLSSSGTSNCSGSTSAGNALETTVTCVDPSETSSQNSDSSGSLLEFSSYEWRPICGDPDEQNILDSTCDPLFSCGPEQIPSQLYGLRNGEWTPLQTGCVGGSSAPTLTPAAVATAFRRIPLPSLRSIAQPGDKTLVNFDTIFHVDAETLHREIRLLGQNVELRITPSRFRWSFGDGTDQVTTTPGSAYPAKTLIHRYQRAHVTVHHYVEVTWTATWRVNGGPWQDVPGEVTLDGPATALRIAEAVPLLSDPDR